MARRNRKENKMADQQALAFSKWLKIKNAVLKAKCPFNSNQKNIPILYCCDWIISLEIYDN